MPDLADRLTDVRLLLRRTVLRRRRLLAAVLAGVAVTAALQATAPPPPPSVRVLVAHHDLAAGTVLGDDDLVEVRWADGTAPAGTVDRADVAGRTLAAPLRRGEPITDVRLVAEGLLGGYPGLVALPVRIPDPGAVALLAVGDRIDLLATDPRDGGTERVAAGAPVLALPGPDGDDSPMSGSGALSGRLVVIGVSETRSLEVADAATRGYLTVSLSG